MTADASAGVLLDHSDVLVTVKRSFMTLQCGNSSAFDTSFCDGMCDGHRRGGVSHILCGSEATCEMWL